MKLKLKLLPKKIHDRLNLTLTQRSVDDSLYKGCVFYDTEIKNVHLTNYDCYAKIALHDLELWDILYIDYTKGMSMKVSFEFLSTATKDEFNKIILDLVEFQLYYTIKKGGNHSPLNHEPKSNMKQN